MDLWWRRPLLVAVPGLVAAFLALCVTLRLLSVSTGRALIAAALLTVVVGGNLWWLGHHRRPRDETTRVALRTIRATLRRPGTDPGPALRAADDLIAARRSAAEAGHDDRGYLESIELFRRLTMRTRGSAPACRLRWHIANYEAYRSRLAAGAGDVTAAREHFRAAEAAARAALELAPPDAQARVQYYCQLGTLLSRARELTGVDRHDEGVAACRRAAMLPSARSGPLHHLVAYHLAVCLVARADAGADSAARDRREAERLCRQAVEEPAIAVRAQRLLARLAEPH